MQVVLVDARYVQGHGQKGPVEPSGGGLHAGLLIPAGSPVEKLPHWMTASLSVAEGNYGHIHASLAQFYRRMQQA
jgi:hypothetical protein